MVAHSSQATHSHASPERAMDLATVTLDPIGAEGAAPAKSAFIAAEFTSDDLEKARDGSEKAGLMDEDDAQQQHSSHLASDERTFVNSIIAFLGSGILGLPFAFRRTGILLGLVMLVLVATVSTYAMLLVVQCKYKLKERGIEIVKYGDIGFHAMGRVGRAIVDVAIVISQAGFCVAYLIFIITNANQFLGVSKELVVAVCVPPLIAFSLLKHMKELAYVALAADVMNFVGLAVVFMVDLSYMAMDRDDIETLGVVSSIPFFFGVASYCFEGVGMVLPLENGMQNPSHFKSVLISTVVIITTLYAAFGVCGYLAFGDATKDVVTLNMTDDGGALLLVKLSLCAGLFFAYPVMMFPVFELLQPLVATKEGSASASGGRVTDDQKLVLLKSCVVVVTATLAVGIPNFGQFISFIGSTCCTLLAFVFPAGFHLLLFPLETKWPKALLLSGLIALGVLAVAAAVSDAAKNLFSG